jgi:glycosyltransferase involved in cell wall biosynthesis
MSSKVVHLSSLHDPYDTRIFHRECVTLAKAGYDVVYVVPYGKEAIVKNVRVKGVPKNFKNRWQRIQSTAKSLYRVAVEEDGDIYHLHDPELIPIGILLRLRRKSVIFDIHENYRGKLLGASKLPSICNRIIARSFDLVEGLLLKPFSAIISADDEITKKLRSLGNTVLTINNYPFPEEFFRRNEKKLPKLDFPYIVNFGGLSNLRVIRHIVSAMNLISPDLHVRLIIGGRSESDALKEEMFAMPGFKRCSYLGQIPRPQMISLLQNAQASLVLYSSVPNHYEVRSNRFFESLAAGIPAITSAFPKWKALVEGRNCGLTVNPHSPESIAKGIEFVIKNPSAASQMGRTGRKLVKEEFSWAIEKERLLNLYEYMTEDEDQ